MFDQDTDVIRAAYGPTGFDFAEEHRAGRLKLHQRAAAEQCFAIERHFGVLSFHREQAALDRQLRIGHRGERNLCAGNHRGHGNKSGLTARREMLFGNVPLLMSERVLEPGEIVQVLEGSIVHGLEDGGGGLRLGLPPHSTPLAPSLPAVSDSEKEQTGDEGGGDEIGEG